jgi:hypothetical protein
MHKNASSREHKLQKLWNIPTQSIDFLRESNSKDGNQEQEGSFAVWFWVVPSLRPFGFGRGCQEFQSFEFIGVLVPLGSPRMVGQA